MFLASAAPGRRCVVLAGYMADGPAAYKVAGAADGVRATLAKPGEFPYEARHAGSGRRRGRSSGVEHNLAKVGVEGSNPFARSKRILGFPAPMVT